MFRQQILQHFHFIGPLADSVYKLRCVWVYGLWMCCVSPPWGTGTESWRFLVKCIAKVVKSKTQFLKKILPFFRFGDGWCLWLVALVTGDRSHVTYDTRCLNNCIGATNHTL